MNPTQLIAALRSENVRIWLEDGDLHYQVPRPSSRIEAWLRQLAEYKTELTSLVGRVGLDSSQSALRSVPAEEAVPVSFEQRRFLFLNELEGPGDTYNLASCFRIFGGLVVPALIEALQSVVDRNDVLRSRFERKDGDWYQVVADRRLGVQATDLISLSGTQREVAVGQLINEDSRRPFDLVHGPHLRARVVRVTDTEHLLIVVMHHIVSDGHSIRLFANAVRHAYLRVLSGDLQRLESPSYQYRDYAAWQHEVISGGIASEIDYWRQQLRGAPPVLDLEIAKPGSRLGRPQAASYKFRLDERVWCALKGLCEEHELTPFHFLLGAYALTLSRHCGAPEVVVGVPASTRCHRSMDEIIGPFINMLALRIDVDSRISAIDFLLGVRQVVLEGVDRSAVPFESVVEALSPARTLAHAPIFQHMFAFEDIPIDLMTLPNARVVTELVDQAVAKYDVTMIVQRDLQGYFGQVRYRSDMFEREAIRRLTHVFQNILGQFVAVPKEMLANVGTLTSEQCARRLDLFRGERHDEMGRCCVHELVERQVDLTPENVAVRFEGELLTYSELDRRANRFANWIRTHGAGPGKVVGVALDPGIDMVCVLLGISKAGAAYLPVALDDPPSRIDFCLRQAGVRLVIGCAGRLPSLESGVLVLDASDSTVIDAMKDSRPALTLDPRNLVSVLFTSGSTGEPKAVMTEHRALVNNLQWMQRNWPLSADDRVLFKAPLTFDVSAKELIWPLMTGAAVVLGRAGVRHDPAYLVRMLRTHAVTVVHLVPTMLEYFVAEASSNGGFSLRMVMCGGEALRPALLSRFHKVFDVQLLHLYGPTEAAIAITGCVLPPVGDGAQLPLGRPTDNSSVYVLDEQLAPVPEGVSGEIFIGGVAVARGYQGRPRETAAAFVPDPYSSEPGGRMYATGDLARILGDGSLVYMGRRDHQIKLYGQRIELAEIEAAIREHASVNDCAVVMARGPSDKPALKAFVVVRSKPQLSRDGLNAHMRSRLAARMIPASIVYLDALPQTPSGKVDRVALAGALDAEYRPVATTSQRASRVVECRLQDIWRELLERDHVGVGENFFEAGGHSLLAIELRDRIRSSFNVDLEVADVFANPTIESLALMLDSESPPTVDAHATRVQFADSPRDGRIAVIGIAGRFPGADDLSSFWRNVEGGVDSVSRFSSRELVSVGYPEDLMRRQDFVPCRAVLGDIEQFDATFFRCTPMEAALLDPQHRLLLECSQLAFDDAGYSAERLARDGIRVGAYVGISNSTYFEHNLRSRVDLQQKYGNLQLAISTNKSSAATQLAFRLNLNGPVVSVDTACSTSLVAIAQACAALLHGETEFALAGGASIDVPQIGGHLWQEGGVGSRDGRCRPFDAAGSGTVRGMGGGIVLLRPLDAALRDGDRVHAVILGSAVNNDGGVKVGFTAPSVTGQEAVMRQALDRAGIAAASVGFVEAHGTGTQLGDPIEIKSLSRVYPGHGIVLGALKGNIGHLDAAAGVAGLLKAILVLKHAIFPPLANFENPNRELDLDALGFKIVRRATQWPAAGVPRRAAVSSFGIGGTNAHLILEEAPDPPSTVGCDTPELFVFSARTRTALSQGMHVFASVLQQTEPLLAEASYTLAIGRDAYPVRCSVVTADRETLRRRCLEVARSEQDGGGETRAASERPKVVFLFPGQGPSMDHAVHQLYGHEAAFTHHLDQAVEGLSRWVPFDFRAHVRSVATTPGPIAPPSDAVVTQPWQFAVATALAASLREVGVVPDMCIGHSLGEYAAACVAGVFPIAQGFEMLAHRGRLIARCGAGSMLVLACPEEEALTLLVDGVDLAASNGGMQCVVAGSRESIDEVSRAANDRGIASRLLQMDRAIHSPMMDPVLADFEDFLSRFSYRPPEIPLASTVTGSILPSGYAPDPGHWRRHLREPVRFRMAIEEVLKSRPDVCLELGAGAVLSPLAASTGGELGNAVMLPLMAREGRGESVSESYLRAIGVTWERGVEVNWKAYFANLGKDREHGYRRARLPGYRFDRKRHWIDPPGRSVQTTERGSETGLWTTAWARMDPIASRSTPTVLVCHDGCAEARDLIEMLSDVGAKVDSVLHPQLMSAVGGTTDPAAFAGDWRDEPAWILVTGAALLLDDGVDDDVLMERMLLSLSELDATWREEPGVLGVSVVSSASLSVTGADTVVAAARALLGSPRPSGTSLPRQYVDLPAAWTSADVGRLLDVVNAGKPGVTAIRNRHVWHPISVPAPLPTMSMPVTRDGGSQWVVAADEGRITQALRSHLERYGVRMDTVSLSNVEDPDWPSPRDSGRWASAVEALPTLFLALMEDPHAWLKGIEQVQRIVRSMPRLDGRIGEVFVLVGKSTGSTPSAISLALATQLDAMTSRPRYLIVESPVWISEDVDAQTLHDAIAFAGAAARSHRNGIVSVSWEVIVRWARLNSGSSEPTEARTVVAEAVQRNVSSSPTEEMERAIAAHWSDLLGVATVQASDNFFGLGGDSLLAGQSIAFLHDAFGVGLTASIFQANANPRDLAVVIKAVQRTRAASRDPDHQGVVQREVAKPNRSRLEL